MKTPTTLILLSLLLINCKKETQITNQQSGSYLASITSVNFDYKENFSFNNDLLETYSVDIYGTGPTVYEIHYDLQKRPAHINKNGVEIAWFFYHHSAISLKVDDGTTDSLFYALDHSAKITRLEKYDDFHGTMLINANCIYSYENDNLVEISNTEYEPNGRIKFQYKESAIYDTERNAFETTHANAVLFEFLFQHIPSRIFTVNSQNNITQLESTHPSDGYTFSQIVEFNAASQPVEIRFLKSQYGFTDEDTELYTYQE